MPEVAASDRELLQRFVANRDSTAFRGLVTRHGPAVLQMCRGVLGNAHDAEDAFQATFMVFVRKAPTLRDPESLGGWLRGAAYRTALRSRCRAARRQSIERNWAAESRNEPPPEELSPEARHIVRTELDRLPAIYRDPVVMCYFDGLTHQEAAGRLGCPVGTVKVRLVRGRRMLRERLDRRGVSLSAAFVFWLMRSGKTADIPGPLFDSTVRAMTLCASGRRGELASKFGSALELFEANSGRPLRLRWILAGVIAGALVLGFSQPLVRALSATPTNGIDPASLPANLTDVLGVYCR
jgi:RNA polymerase sigma factor (sigma-70 family)